jgi:hypothetical protein
MTLPTDQDLARNVVARFKNSSAGLPGRYAQFLLEVSDHLYRRLGIGWKVSDPSQPGNVLSGTIQVEVSRSNPPPEFAGPHDSFSLSVTVQTPMTLEVYLAADKSAMKKDEVPVSTSAQAIAVWAADALLSEMRFHREHP